MYSLGWMRHPAPVGGPTLGRMADGFPSTSHEGWRPWNRTPRFSHQKPGPEGRGGGRQVGVEGRARGIGDRGTGDGGGLDVDAGCSSWVSYEPFVGKRGRCTAAVRHLPADVRPTTPKMNALCIMGYRDIYYAVVLKCSRARDTGVKNKNKKCREGPSWACSRTGYVARLRTG